MRRLSVESQPPPRPTPPVKVCWDSSKDGNFPRRFVVSSSLTSLTSRESPGASLSGICSYISEDDVIDDGRLDDVAWKLSSCSTAIFLIVICSMRSCRSCSSLTNSSDIAETKHCCSSTIDGHHRPWERD